MSTAPNGSEERWPSWADEIVRALPFSGQFVVYGAIADLQLAPDGDRLIHMPLVDCLWQRLQTRDFSFILVFNGTSGLRVIPRSAARLVGQHLPLSFDGGDGCGRIEAASLPGPLGEGVDHRFGPQTLPALADAVHRCQVRCALVVEDASRLIRDPARLDEQEHHILASCRRILHDATPRPRDPDNAELHNPTVWLADSLRDLPDWLVAAGDRSRALAAPLPAESIRRAWADRLVQLIAPELKEDARNSGAQRFAGLSEGLSLREMHAVARIAVAQQTPLADIADAIRSYKVGQPEDPWKSPGLRVRLRNGEAEIRRSVKGQAAAVQKTLDVLKRAALGLSGAQASTSPGRPRGVLFFAGPTGVGKTQLAKAISSIVFDAPDAYVRFDMSEFSAEHSDAKLIGAPPGYVGFDAGGELVNAVRARPFSVILFDEVEKAHPRILDKFLQVLEDGRLTDGRGDTVHFSETILIFTSNLGVSRRDEYTGLVTPLITPKNSYTDIEQAVRRGVKAHFTEQLQRPELYNRIGEDNVIVFNFISREIGEEIFAMNLENIRARFRTAMQVDLDFAPDVVETVRNAALSRLENGGRGIGAAMETVLVNPVVRELFERGVQGGRVFIEQLILSGDEAWTAQIA